MTISFSVNSLQREVEAKPAERLSVVLRDRLGLSGTKVGCDAGDCGACTVLINGEMACACLTAAAQVEGCSVATIEGLAKDGALSKLQDSFLVHGAAQCGICTPGMLMAASALIARTPKPSKTEVEEALGGVLCRCTGYSKIVEAVLEVVKPAATHMPQAGRAVGSPVVRLDGVSKVRGEDRFGADIRPVNAVAVRVIRSPHHAARFTLGDIEAYARKHGLLAVFTARDIPGRNLFGTIPKFIDQPVFAENEVRFRGEAIAAVAGEPDVIRTLNAADFPVMWEPLPAALTPGEALKDNARQILPERPGNILVRGHVERGDTGKGFAEAAFTVEGSFTTPFIEHAYIEPEAGYAQRDGDRLTIYGCTQAPVMDKESVADIMGLALHQVRVIPSACGGGFGSKLDISFQPYVALAAWRLNRPAFIAYTRAESMQSTTKRHPSEIAIRAGCDAEGKITALDFDSTFNTGAYSSWGPTVANRVPVHASGPYFTPNYKALSKAVLTNCMPAGAFRGFGVPQSLIALECSYDLLADKAGIDRLDFRIRNALREGEPTVTGQVFETGVGIAACLDALKGAWARARKGAAVYNKARWRGPLRKGVGVASCWYGCGNTSLPNPSTIRIGISREGRVLLHQGATDIGQGSNTVIAQIAADALGLPLADISLISPDTDLTPDCGKTSASRQTFVTGNAAKKAGEALRRLILRAGNVGEGAKLALDGGRLFISDRHNKVTLDLGPLPLDERGYVFSAEETYDPPTKALDAMGQGSPYAQYGYGAQLVELTVDIALGKVKLDHIVAAHDVGRAVNPMLVEGQIEGGIAQGIGLALMEEYAPGRTENLHDYLIPTVGDMPKITPVIIEVEDAEGPFGAKGLGEHVLIPTAPAILNAIRDATGALVRNLPATPDKVLAAIKEARR